MSSITRALSCGAACLLLLAHAGRPPSYEVLVHLETDPENPVGSSAIAALMEASDGFFYGTTTEGGALGGGSIFRLDRDGVITALHSFEPWQADINPNHAVIEGTDGAFYGTTGRGGDFALGTIYRMDKSGEVSVLHTFDANGPHWPAGPLVESRDGFFYGTTLFGGAHGVGAVYRSDRSGVVTVVHSFDGTATGLHPTGSLIEADDGFLYGTTNGGGGLNAGTAFRMEHTGTVTVLHMFDPATSGAQPRAMIQGKDGLFYGTTATGGLSGGGTVFVMDATGIVTVLHNFEASTEGQVATPLVEASDGYFYGATEIRPPPDESGVLYKIDRLGNFAVLHEFANPSGWFPFAPLVQGTDGRLYGTTQSGGAFNGGVIYRVALGASQPRIHVIAPHASARWTIGSTQTIRWSHNLDPDTPVRIELTRDGGASWEVLAASVEHSRRRAGRFSWFVTGPATDSAAVRVSSIDGSAIDVSARTFRIADPRTRWMITDLGLNAAASINDLGQIVGLSNGPNEAPRAFLWERGLLAELGTLGEESSAPFDINERGQVVGRVGRTDEDGMGFLWKRGVIRTLGTLPGGTFSPAQAVNNRGQIVGYADTASGEVHAYLWERGTMTDLGTLPGGSYSAALGINDRGQVVGSSTTGNGEVHAFLWQDGTFVDLGTLGGSGSLAWDINDRGQIVGWSTTAAPEGTRAFLWEGGVRTRSRCAARRRV